MRELLEFLDKAQSTMRELSSMVWYLKNVFPAFKEYMEALRECDDDPNPMTYGTVKSKRLELISALDVEYHNLRQW